MDVDYVVLVAVAIVMALAYGILGFFADKVKYGGNWDWAKFGATIVYSIIVGVIAVQTGVINLTNLANWQTVFSPVWMEYVLIYTGLLYVFGKIVVPVAQQVSQRTVLFTKKFEVGLVRKMDPESRGFLVFDLPEVLKQPTLAAVDAAEAVGTYLYAIQSGSWIFLIEGGELTGAKHYYFRGWFGTQNVEWKVISDQCITEIRTTGKFPEYRELY